MNKKQIISILDNYNLDKNEFTIITGAALVLLDIIEETRDIDICVTENYCNFLLNNYECKYERTNEYGKAAYLIDNVINFSSSFEPNKYVLIEGYKVASLKDCYKTKEFLNRDKDKELLDKLKKIIE